MTDEEMEELAKQVDKVTGPMGTIGRLGVRTPGEPASSFPKEEPETEENESPHGEAENIAFAQEQKRMMNPMNLPPEAQAALRASMTPERWQQMKRRALDQM